jgi:hypothetical protein
MEYVNSDAKRRLRRSKDSERRLAKWLMTHDGPDPHMMPGNGIVSPTGRVGHVTSLQFDALSLHYAGENKNEKIGSLLWAQWATAVRDGVQFVSNKLPAELGRYWLKISQKAVDWGKTPLIRIEPTNDDIVFVNGKRISNLHIITEERHAELLGYEKLFLEKTRSSPGPTKIGYSKDDQVGRSPGRKKR